ncbi:hypothetical protein BMF94_0553 [Rhodotorula taiwanensis]|uniref:Methyltransferase small domain-containing protein n=1 Tax=Rhodotorula taiwanensis TaxID=741276 RepID=A0A2S5BHV4_9BASI|nr:hypothetical protein BMF94_0553 [Rhodotorula taiwanensis]
MLPTPLTPHLSKLEYESVYEPAGESSLPLACAPQDTFILLDALEQDAELLKGSRICLEIGSGSGCVTAFLSGICGPTAAGPDPKQHTRTVYLTTDLNPIACESTLLTAETNSHPFVETVNTDLTASLLPRLTRQVDVLVFNPPYVETVDEEAIEAQAEEDKGIEKTWAGGHHGMRVTNRLLEQVKDLLSPRGLFYLVAVPENKPLEILSAMKERGLQGEIVLKRRAGREHLHILRFRHLE